MRPLLTALSFLQAGHASSTSSGYETPDFHDYLNPDTFCHDVGLGNFALGYRQGDLPWVDQILCANGEGVHIVSATKNGKEIDVETMHTTSLAGRSQQFAWASWSPDSRVSMNNNLHEGCSGNTKPYAIITLDTQISTNGAFISNGAILCIEGADLVMHVADLELERWTNFVPIH